MADFRDEMRNDPVLRAKVEKIHKARQVMLLKAAKQLRELTEEMRELGQYRDDGIYNRCWDEVRMATFKVERDAEFMQKIGGETYIGNLAANKLGHLIEGKEW